MRHPYFIILSLLLICLAGHPATAQERLRVGLSSVSATQGAMASKFYNQIPYATLKAVNATLDFVALDEPKAKGADAKLFLDESIVRELESSGFFKNLYENEYR